MNKIQLTARFKIHAGKLDAFKKLAGACMSTTKEKDKGVLQYDWFFSDDQSECIVRETYKDSAAVLNHVTILGDLLGQTMALADFSAEGYGNMSEELKNAFGGMGVKMYSYYQGL